MMKLKYSGVEWIGDIPTNWELKRGKNIFLQRNTKGNENPVLLAASQKYGMYPQHLLDGVVQVKEDTDFQTFKTVHKNDYVISLRSFQGGFEMSDYEGVCSPAYQVLYNRIPIDYRYYKMLFKSDGFISKMNSLTVGIREGKNIQYSDFARSMILYPPLETQSRIADYLDKKCAKIDEIIEKQQAVIEKLKEYKLSVITETVTKGLNPDVEMKDSGNEWIGQIPLNWNVTSLGALSISMRNGYVGPTRDIFYDEGIPYIQSLHVKDGTISFEKEKYFVSEEWGKKHPKVYEGQLLIVQTGDIGQVGLVSKEMNGYNCHALIIVTVNEEYITPTFLSYYLRSHVGKELLLGTKTGALLPHLNSGKIKVTPIVCPSIEEQNEIVKFLNQKCWCVNEIISKKEVILGKLHDYKKSLIYEVVTGKKEV